MNTLKIDMDWIPPGEWLYHYVSQIPVTLTRFQIKYAAAAKPRQDILTYRSIRVKTSRSQHGLHIIIRLNGELDDETVNMLQFLLGDDRNRCRLNAIRIRLKYPRWNKLFI